MAPKILGTPVEGVIKTLLDLNYSYRMILNWCKKRQINCSHGTIKRIKNKCNKIKNCEKISKMSHPILKKLSKSDLKKLKNMTLKPNPISQRLMAKKLNTCATNINYHIHKTLKLYTRMKPKVHCLNENQIQKRKTRSIKLYNLLSDQKWKSFITSDEAWFTFNVSNEKTKFQYVSRARKNHELEVVERKENNAKGFMVWGGVSFQGKTNLYFIKPGVKINSTYYINSVLKKFINRDAKKLYPKNNYIFQHDSAPAHVSKLTKNFMDKNMKYVSKDIWPPKSPDLAPMDYFVWGWMKSRLKKYKVSNMASFKRALIRVWKEIPQKFIINALQSWKKRCYLVNRANGGHIEKY